MFNNVTINDYVSFGNMIMNSRVHDQFGNLHVLNNMRNMAQNMITNSRIHELFDNLYLLNNIRDLARHFCQQIAIRVEFHVILDTTDDVINCFFKDYVMR